MDSQLIEQAAASLAGGRRVLVCAGSGLSAESGVPTFRGKEGIFNDPDIARLTHVSTFESDREEMMQWYQARRDALAAIEPNPGHLALLKLARLGDYTVATQNVDHLLEAAADQVGFRPEIHHLHGSLLEVRCNRCGYSFEDLDLDLGAMPTCERCGGPLRPGVVWFGENLPSGSLEASAQAARLAEVCLIIGTSGMVQPAASLPHAARAAGATLIEINPNPSELSSIAHLCLRGPAGEVLPALLSAQQKLEAHDHN